MKHLLILSLFLGACSSSPPVTVTTSDGTHIQVGVGNRLGGQGSVVANSGGATVVVSDNNENSFQELNKTARFGLGVSGLKSVAKTTADAITQVKNAKSAVDTAKVAAGVDKAQIAADVEKQALNLKAQEFAAGLQSPE